MCIIIVLKPLEKMKEEISKEILEKSWKSNKDGSGFCYVKINNEDKKKNIVEIQKGFFAFKGFYKIFKRNRIENPKSFFMIHFRNATTGKIEYNNCHPFWLTKYKTALAHNGTIYKMDEKDKGKSDSKVLAEFFSQLPTYWFVNKGYRLLVEHYIGKNNKIAVLSNLNSVHILNSSLWFKENDGDIFYSSDYYKNERIVTKNYSTWMECNICHKKEYKIFKNGTCYCDECYKKAYPENINIKNNDIMSTQKCKKCNLTLLKNEVAQGKGLCYNCNEDLDVELTNNAYSL
jgi:predicted glutamine amidotransferase